MAICEEEKMVVVAGGVRRMVTAAMLFSPFSQKGQPHLLQIRHCSLETRNVQDQSSSEDVDEDDEEGVLKSKYGGDSISSNGEENDWTTLFLLFVFYGGLMYYVFFLAPDQTASMDKYLLEKLLNLKGDDGFLVCCFFPLLEARREIYLSGHLLLLHVMMVPMLLFPTLFFGDHHPSCSRN